MKLLKVKTKWIKHYNTLNDYQMTSCSYMVKEPLYKVELTQEEYELVIDLFKALDKVKEKNNFTVLDNVKEKK